MIRLSAGMLRRLSRPTRWSVLLVLTCVIVGGGTSAWGAASAKHHSPAQVASAERSAGVTQGAILSPIQKAGNIPEGNTLTAYGTIRNLQPHHHLLLFVRVGNGDVYWGGDPQQQVIKRGTWSLNIYIASASNGQTFTLYLTDLGPQSWAFLSGPHAVNYWNSGFPSPAPGSDATVLSRVNFKGWKSKT